MKPNVQNYVRWTFFLSVLFLNGCASLVETNVERSANFREFKTYAWLKPEIKTGDNPVYKNEIINRNIMNTVNNELQSRGLSINPETPDLLVQYRTFTEKKQRNNYGGMYNSFYSPFGMPFGYGWGRMGWGMGGGYGFPYYGGGYGGYGGGTYQYTSGTLVLEFTDNHTHQVIWSGSVGGDVEYTKNLNIKVEKAVHAIMKKYPLKLHNEAPIS